MKNTKLKTMKTKILDCTIRDGGYLNDWAFENTLVRDLYSAVSKSGTDYVEIGFRNSEEYVDTSKLGIWTTTPEEIVEGVVKNNSAIELLGCSLKKFKEYLENQFEPGMSWENYGADGWHIDHIKPCISFDLRFLPQREECFHYLNMRPMWAAENVKKSSIYKGKNYRRSCISS